MICFVQLYVGAVWLTDSRDGRWAVTELNFLDSKNDFLYFTAARSVKVGSDKETEQHKRQIFRVGASSSTADKEPECVTCALDTEEQASKFLFATI